MDKVSVIIPVYNAEQWLVRCVDSVLSQTYRNIEVILVNDGSKDESGSICDGYAAKDNRVRVIHKKNAGVSAARNDGIASSTGENIAFIDADDRMEADFIETLMLHKEYPLVVAGYEEFGVRDRKRGPSESKEVNVTCDIPEIWKDKDSTYWWFVWGKLYRRNIMLRNNLQFKEDMMYLEDYCFVLEYLCCIEDIYMDESKAMYHLIEAEKYTKYRMDYAVFRKHMEVLYYCIEKLERKCQCEFVEMRKRISYRHFYNFMQYLRYSPLPLKIKLHDVASYQRDKHDSLYRDIKIKEYGLRIRTHWAVMRCLNAFCIRS